MIVRFEGTLTHISMGQIIISDLRKVKHGLKKTRVFAPVETLGEVIKSFWTVLNYDAK